MVPAAAPAFVEFEGTLHCASYKVWEGPRWQALGHFRIPVTWPFNRIKLKRG